MRKPLRQTLAVIVALTLVVTAVGGAVQTGMVDREDVSPVGESQAIACGGLCIAGVAGAAAIAGGAVSYKAFASDVNTSALEGADAQETKTNIYQQGTTQYQNSRILLDSMDNSLEGAKTIARLEGKQAYIRALENGSSEAEARSKAVGAVEDYYATKQLQLINSYETSASVSLNLANKAANTTDVSSTFVAIYSERDGTFGNEIDRTQASVSLVNGSSRSYQAVSYGETFGVDRTSVYTAGIGGDNVDLQGVGVQAPTNNNEDEYLLNATDYGAAWTKIQNQHSTVQSEVDTFVTNTYTEYQQGAINESDLVDPYLEAREYSPEGDYQTWAVRSLAATGVEPPENVSSYGDMVVRDSTGEQISGLLLSDGLPTSGSYTVGETYNASTIDGPQYVASGQTTHQLNGQFTLLNVTTPDGEHLNEGEQIDYSQVDYQTSNITEFKERLNRLQKTAAEIEARQQKLRNPSGGGGFLGGGSANPTAVVLVGAVVALAVMFGRNER